MGKTVLKKNKNKQPAFGKKSFSAKSSPSSPGFSKRFDSKSSPRNNFGKNRSSFGDDNKHGNNRHQQQNKKQYKKQHKNRGNVDGDDGQDGQDESGGFDEAPISHAWSSNQAYDEEDDDEDGYEVAGEQAGNDEEDDYNDDSDDDGSDDDETEAKKGPGKQQPKQGGKANQSSWDVSFPSVEGSGFGLDGSKDQKKKGKKSGGFESMGLDAAIFKAIKLKGFRVPTPIQRKAIPLLLNGRDVVAMARTGSGKTAAFLIPMFQKLVSHSSKVGIRGIVLSPTRELALQTLKFAKDFGKFTDLRLCLLVGGEAMEDQFASLANNPDVVIATPGRLAHHLSEVDALTLSCVEYLVFDEADRLFELGFSTQITEIVRKMPEGGIRQTALFSATIPAAVAQFARAGLSNPEIVRLDTETKVSEHLVLEFIATRSGEKNAALLFLLRKHIQRNQQTVIFVATKNHVEFVCALLTKFGFAPAMVYGEMDQAARKINLGKFRSGKSDILVVTDVAARGIDLPLLDNVINYHFPAAPKLFLHRVGRVARAGRSGTAYSLVSHDEIPYVIDVHLFLGKPVTDENGKSLIGVVPQSALDLEEEDVRIALSNHEELQQAHEAAKKAYIAFLKSRSAASMPSVGRAKELPPSSVHPLFASDSAVKKEAVMSALRGFRPRETIFEVNSAVGQGYSAMEKKRKMHEKTITETQVRNTIDANIKTLEAAAKSHQQQHQQQQQQLVPSGDNFNSHYEDGLAIRKAYTGHNAASRIEDMVMDVAPDEADALMRKQGNYQWDHRKRKFVQVQHGKEQGAFGDKKKTRTESGSRQSAGMKMGLYDKWQRQMKGRIQDEGEVEEEGSSAHLRNRRSSLPSHSGAPQTKFSGKQIKNKDQLLKERKKKAREKERLSQLRGAKQKRK